MIDRCGQVTLMLILVAGLAVQPTVCIAGSGSPSPVSLELPHAAWTVATVGRRLVVFSLGPLRDAAGGRAANDIAELRACSLRVGTTGGAREDPSWVLLSKVGVMFATYPFTLAALPDPTGDRARLVIEAQVGATTFQFMRVRIPGEAKDSPRRGALPADPHPRHDPTGSFYLRRVDYRGAKPHFFLGAFMSPSFAQFGGQTFLAGQSFYPQRQGEYALWAAGLSTLKGRGLTGVLLGRGRGPALLSSAGKLICLGIVPLKAEGANRHRFHGRLVAWASDDGTRWKPWQHGLRLADIFAVDACSDGKSTLIACAHNPSAPAVSVFRLVAESGKLRLVRTIAGGATYRATKPMAIRLIDGKPYLFTPREADGKRTLVIGLIRPARDAGSTP